MDKHEFKNAMAELGLACKWATTGDPRWTRAYLQVVPEKGIPCQYGRASFHDGKLYNVKWYFKQQSDIELNDSDRMIFMWSFYERHGVAMTRELYDATVVLAHQQADACLADRLAKRAQTNKRNPKKRPSIKGRNVRNFIRDLINVQL